MSRIGSLTILLPETVSFTIEGYVVKISGPKGSLERKLPRLVSVEKGENGLDVKVRGESKLAKSLHGTYRAILANMVKGVTDGWSKQLELVGTGYRAETNGSDLTLTVGFSHPIKISAPEFIS